MIHTAIPFLLGWALLQPAPSDPTPPASDNDECLGCHDDPDIEPTKSEREPGVLYVSAEKLTGSVHEDVECVECHAVGDESEAAHYDDDGALPSLQCPECHPDASETFEEDCIHGQERARGNPKAPYCGDCHGAHDIQAVGEDEGKLSHHDQPKTCAVCHDGETTNGKEHVGKRRLIDRYFSSVHWESLQEGKPAATCSDCHGSHNILPSSETKSQVTRAGLLAACGKCHSVMVQSYAGGAHGRTLLHGNHDVPTCTTCHGDHDVISLKTQAGGTREWAGTQVCIWCHGNSRMMARYDLDTSPVDSYMRDIHGLTQRGSLGTSATCADCHDAHHALPATNPESRMHLNNRETVCGKCHGETSANFLMSFSHRRSESDPLGGRIKQVVILVYVIVIILTIGAMMLHNAVVWSYFFRRKKNFQKQHPAVRRLTRAERTWHLVMILSFSLLVASGFALSFAESWAFRWLVDFGITENVRSWLHRIGGVVMILDMGVLVAFAFSRQGRDKWWRAMWPRWQDVKDAVATMRFYLMRSKSQPRYDVFNYAEKAEYWALWWGAVVMAVTGLVMWFSYLVPAKLPNWLFDVARTIHYYEAVLATLAILVWHIFHVLFHPAEYPMNTAWITGMLYAEEAEERFTPEAIEAQRPPPMEDADPPHLERPWLDEEE